MISVLLQKKKKFFFHFFQLFSTSGFGRDLLQSLKMLSSLVRAAASRAPQLAAVSFAAVSRSRAAASSSSSTRWVASSSSASGGSNRSGSGSDAASRIWDR